VCSSDLGLELTDAGRLALCYADEIFALGNELRAALESHMAGPTLPLRVGITDVVPKAIAYRLIEPAERQVKGLRLICREGKLDRLLAELALHRLDMVIADRPIPPNINVRGYSHELGASEIALFALPALLATDRPFPECLNDGPLLLPGDDSMVRGQIERWLERQHLTPRIAGEFDDDALMRAFGQAGGGYFPGAAVLAEEMRTQHGVVLVGRVEGVRESFYAITGERHNRHPAVTAITGAAQSLLVPR
jgi:LysR family transcriptional activator of nhaA